jgi:hypothetical protein
MDEGQDTRRNIIRESDGFRNCLLGHEGAVLQVSGEKAIGIAGKPLLSQPPLQVFGRHPQPVQNPPPQRKDCNQKNEHRKQWYAHFSQRKRKTGRGRIPSVGERVGNEVNVFYLSLRTGEIRIKRNLRHAAPLFFNPIPLQNIPKVVCRFMIVSTPSRHSINFGAHKFWRLKYDKKKNLDIQTFFIRILFQSDMLQFYEMYHFENCITIS